MDDAKGLSGWFYRFGINPLITPLFLTDDKLFGLFKSGIEQFGSRAEVFHDLRHLMYVSSRCSKNFLPYLSRSVNSDFFNTAFSTALTKYSVRKQELMLLIAEAEPEPTISDLPQSDIMQENRFWAKLLDHMKKFPHLRPMFKELKSEQCPGWLPNLVCSGDGLDKENKPEESGEKSAQRVHPVKEVSLSGDSESPEGIKRLHVNC